MATQIFDVTTIVRALAKMEEEFFGENRKWERINYKQSVFLELYDNYKKDVLKMGNMKTLASRSAAELNKFLAENGFDIRLEDLGPDGVGVVAILDRLVKWLAEADSGEQKIYRDGTEYPAFRLEGTGVRFYISKNHYEPIAELETQTGDKVYLTKLEEPFDGLELTERALDIIKSQKVPCCDYKGVIIPEVMIDKQVDISFLLGMSTKDSEGDPWFISQALQQAKFAMNKEGARVKVATALAAVRYCVGPIVEPPDLIFDSPFLLWIVGREGSDLPLISIYVDTDSWKSADLNSL